MMRYNRDQIFWGDPYFQGLYWMTQIGFVGVLFSIWWQTPWFPWN